MRDTIFIQPRKQSAELADCRRAVAALGRHSRSEQPSTRQQKARYVPRCAP
jgi:hypothetical protein